MRIIVLVGFLFALSSNLFAQSYNTAGGIRLGTQLGVSVQQLIGKKNTLEGIVQYDPNEQETVLTLLYEMHKPILLRNMNFYYGGGAHSGFYKNQQEELNSTFGIDGILGLELTYKRINISFDYKPVFYLDKRETNFANQTALSVRYVFVKRHKKGIEKAKDKLKDLLQF